MYLSYVPQKYISIHYNIKSVSATFFMLYFYFPKFLKDLFLIVKKDSETIIILKD